MDIVIRAPHTTKQKVMQGDLHTRPNVTAPKQIRTLSSREERLGPGRPSQRPTILPYGGLGTQMFDQDRYLFLVYLDLPLMFNLYPHL